MNRLKELRNNAKLSQQKLADRLNVARSTIAMWETGGSQPDSNYLNAIADFFNVSVDYLLGRTNDRIDDTVLDKVIDIDNDLLEKAGNIYDAKKLQRERDKKNGVDGQSILNRFFEALAILGIPRKEFYFGEPITPDTKLSDIEVLDDYTSEQYVERIMKYIDKYGISKDWVFEGKGKMFCSPSKTEPFLRDEGTALYEQLDEIDKVKAQGYMENMLEAEKYKQDTAEMA